ncbi:7089_t:CDS:2, partial [Acaulospora colombiana]
MKCECVEMKTKWREQYVFYQEFDPKTSSIIASALGKNSIGYLGDNTPLIAKPSTQPTESSQSDSITLALFVAVVVMGFIIWWYCSEDLYMIYRIYKLFLKLPDVTSENKQGENQSRQPAQPLKTTTDTKSLLSKKTKSTIAKASPATAKTSAKTRSKVKSDSSNNISSTVEVSSKPASSDVISSPCAAASAETLPGGASSLAANVSSTITTMLNAKLHADASSTTPFTSQQILRARGKIREDGHTSDEPLKNHSMSEIQERTLEVIAAYEEIGNAFKRAALAVEKLKTILPPGTSIVIPQLPVAPEIPGSQSSVTESTDNTRTDRHPANATTSSASNNASIQNILNDTSSDSTNNDNDIWEYNDLASLPWASQGDSSTWPSKGSSFVDNNAGKETTSPPPLSFQDSECTHEPDNIDMEVYGDKDEVSVVSRVSGNYVEIIDDNHLGNDSESSIYDHRNEMNNTGRKDQNKLDVNGEDVDQEAQIVTGGHTAKISEESGTFDYSNTKFTDEEIFILEEFNKYYSRRMLTDKSTKQSKVATEISSFTPKVTFEQTAVSKL